MRLTVWSAVILAWLIAGGQVGDAAVLSTPDGRVVIRDQTVFIRPATLVNVDTANSGSGRSARIRWPADAIGPAGNGKTAQVLVCDNENRRASLTADLGLVVSHGTLMLRVWSRGYGRVIAAGGAELDSLSTFGDIRLSPHRIEWRSVQFSGPTRYVRIVFRTPPGHFAQQPTAPPLGGYPDHPPPGYEPLPDAEISERDALWFVDAICVRTPVDALSLRNLRDILHEATGRPVNEEKITAQILSKIAADTQTTRRSRLRQLCSQRGNGGSITFGFASAMRPVVDLHDLPEQAVGRAGQLALAGNETEAIQLVLLGSDQPVEDIALQFEDLRGAEGQRLAADQINWGLVRDVPNTVEPSRPRYPDWISPVESFSLQPGQLQKLWITVRTDPNQPPGLYRGRLKVIASDTVLARPSLSVHVWGFSLPQRLHMDTVLQHEADPDMMLAHHFNPGSIASPRYLLQADGAIAMEFHRYDQMIEQARRQGLTTFRLPLDGRHLHRPIHSFVDVATGQQKDLSLGISTGKRLIQFINIYCTHLKQRGWLADAIFYLWDEPDEKWDGQIVAEGQVLHEACPQLKLLVTTTPRAVLDEVVDIYVPSAKAWLFEESHQQIAWARERGKAIWWYTGGDNYPAPVFGRIGYPPTVWRIHFWMNWRFGVSGSLYWAANWNQGEDAPEWPGLYGTGCGMLYYRDKGPSVRLEMIRDGIEDYEYLAMLDELTSDQPGHPGRELLTIPSKLAQGLTRYCTDPEPWLAHRQRVAEAIEKLAAQK